jgi:hypothetical protein
MFLEDLNKTKRKYYKYITQNSSMKYEKYGKGKDRKDAMIVVRLKRKEKERLRAVANMEEVSMANIVRKAIKNYLNS